MKVINIMLISLIICLGFGTSCFSQGSNDKALQERVDELYRVIPNDLKVDELLQRINEEEQRVGALIDSISSKEGKEKARLIRMNGLLWSLGNYVLETNNESLKSELTKRIKGLDLDSPSLELLDDVEVANLLNGYFRVFMPNVSDLDRATYVLYNVKSEKIRNPYVLTALVSTLKQNGYTDAIQGVIEDIELCSKTEATIQKAHELKAQYYPVRVGEMAPDFEMEDEFGKMVKLSDFRGKIVFIDVWATWCGGCVEGLPYFMALRDQYKDQKDLVLLTISDDGIEAKSRWLKFLKEKKYSGKVPHLIINEEKDTFTKDYCITGIPRYILIDKEGKIVNAWHIAAKHELFSWAFKMELDNMNRE